MRIICPVPGILSAGLLVFACAANAQTTTPFTNDQIREMVAAYKVDPRGPFQIVKWFCPDGSVIGARERCSEPGGQQHAVVKDAVQRLRVRNGVFLGQILAGTDPDEFLDASRYLSRSKQYQMEKFLARIDDGWIFREARFYRGAFQIEDEEAWGDTFLKTMLSRDNLVRSQYYALRELTRDLPHARTDDIVQKSRSLSQEISDAFPAFLDLRIKIHGQPDRGDIALVDEFRKEDADRASATAKAKLDELYATLQRQYDVDYAKQLALPLSRLRRAGAIATSVREFNLEGSDAATRSKFFAELAARIRTELTTYPRPSERLALVDLSLLSESIVFRSAGEWKPATRRELIDKAIVLRTAAFGGGLLEVWEYDELRREEGTIDPSSLSAAEFKLVVERMQRAVEWSAGTVSAAYRDVVELFLGFEPMAYGFVDDRIRSTVLLAFGETVSRIGEEYATHVGLSNEVLEFDAASARGLNPGVALGVLEVVTGAVDDIAFQTDRIYVMARTPAELKPVAGIATVTEGNMVSHVQLLARNLGIPNAVFPQELVNQLAKYSGERVFYAVSPGGRVRMKRAKSMNAEERALVEQRIRDEALVRVPTKRLDLADKRLISLYELRATDSGRVCGPKAANLGQLSALFPGRVAPGFIVPFGLFREHMDQTMPGLTRSYWQELQSIFARAASKRKEGVATQVVDDEVLASLAVLRAAIEKMPLRPSFLTELRNRFPELLGASLGQVPVFVRSDTNMEDLKDFTGAGLNLTVPNVVSESDILDAIRRVWASPFRERGYRWRQKYLLNPEDVYPSLLILKSVNVEKSGVMITAGVTAGTDADYTVAFNRGVGGAVDGQAAESYLLRADGSSSVLSPAREPKFTVLPPKGGTEKRNVTFESRILTTANLEQLRLVGVEIRRVLPGQPGIETAGPFDVELGFEGDRVILFQARPFVQNKNAGSIAYLSAMDRTQATPKRANLREPISRR